MLFWFYMTLKYFCSAYCTKESETSELFWEELFYHELTGLVYKIRKIMLNEVLFKMVDVHQ